jgi:hypothetical protein
VVDQTLDARAHRQATFALDARTPLLSAGTCTVTTVPSPRSTHRLLVVEARDLDTDERRRRTVAVEQPSTEAGQRTQMQDVVAELHPQARIRSFGQGAASFLDADHLIVVHYGDRVEDDGLREPEPQAQQPLFAT